MKKKNLKKMSLNKENISQLSLSGLKGGTETLATGNLSCHTAVTRVRSCFSCFSREYNCNSNAPMCDCGTTGNCGDLV